MPNIGEQENMSITFRSHARAFVWACLLLFISACGPTVSVARFTADTFPSVEPSQVQIFSSTVPNRSYSEIGIIEVEEGPGSQTYDEMIQALRSRAAGMGANAVLIDAGKRSQGALLYGGLLMAIDAKYIKATAIRWSEK